MRGDARVSDPVVLVEAMRLFLARHEEALASGDPSRGMDAADGLVAALADTLPGELARVEHATERHKLARGVLERRMSELEGLARQLKLGYHQLEERNVDVLRLVALLTATRRQIRALQQTLELWAAEHGAASSAPPSPHAAFDAVRAAREALGAGCADAAREALAEAARRSGIEAPARIADLLEGWAALDDVERAIHRRQMGMA